MRRKSGCLGCGDSNQSQTKNGGGDYEKQERLAWRKTCIPPTCITIRPRSFTEIAKDKMTVGSSFVNLRQVPTKALKVARAAVRRAGRRKKIRIPLVIPFETKDGGFLLKL